MTRVVVFWIESAI